MEPDVWGYNWATLSLGDINTGTWSSRLGVGHKADDLSLQKYISGKSKVETGRSSSQEWTTLPESSKEG
jgi:hypothetical protein